MRIALIVLQLILAVACAALLVITFFTAEHIRERSKSYIVQRVIRIVDPQVAVVEELLKGPGVTRVLNAEQIEAITREVAHYRSDPQRYVVEIVDDEVVATSLVTEEASSSSKSLQDKLLSWKRAIASHFAESYRGLLRDIRIFFASNVVALLVAAVLIRRSASPRVLVVSALLTFAIIISTVSYLDQSWFLRMLINSYMGLAYPIGIAMTWAWLVYDYAKDRGWGLPDEAPRRARDPSAASRRP